MEQLIGNLEVDEIVGQNPDLFLPERLEWIGKDSVRSRMHQYSFVRIIQHWAVSEGIHQKQLTRFLVLLHTFQPTLKLLDYATLPKDGRTLLKIPCQTKREFSSPIQPFYAPALPGTGKSNVHIGNYVHFGLGAAITGKSLGMNHRFHYVNLLRRIHTVFPSLLPSDILELTKPSPEEVHINRPGTWKNWLLRDERIFRDVEPVVFEVKINVDGVQWFKSSNTSGTPIFGKLVAIRSLSGKTRVKIPYHVAKPFVIGVYENIHGKPLASRMMAGTLAEMKALHPDSLLPGAERDGESFAVQVRCFNCDDPMRRDLKGIKHSGSFSCERCHSEGEYLNKEGQKIAKKPKAPSRKKTHMAVIRAALAKAAAAKIPRLANAKAVTTAIRKPSSSKPTGKRPSKNPGAKKQRVNHGGFTYFPDQNCRKRTDECWDEYLEYDEGTERV
jgi:hypothetical protein